MSSPFEFGLSLLAAHAMGDYVFQTHWMAAQKRRFAVLLLHALIQAVVAYLLAGRWGAWTVLVTIGVSHALIDRVKLAFPRGRSVTLLLDQAAHGLVIGALMVWLPAAQEISFWSNNVTPHVGRLWILITGAIVTVRVAGIFIGFWVQPYLKEIDSARGATAVTPMSRGLTNGGRTIGQWERAIIFLLVGVGQPAGIGFLIAAKSIFRFGELKDRENRMEAEYITIGTLMSFGWAMVSAYLTWWLARR